MSPSVAPPADSDASSLTIVDGAGFVSTDPNNFEAFCANYMHERLHQVVIDHLFKQEVCV